MSKRFATGNTIKMRTRGFFICLLLALYLCGTSGFEILHHIIHLHEHAVEHTEQAEEDPCHRALYHQDKENGCEHRSHIVVADKCDLCDVIAPVDALSLSLFSFTSDFLFPEKNTFGRYIIHTGANLHLPSRAPPAV